MSKALKRILNQPNFSVEQALEQIKLGDDPNTLNSDKKSLMDLLIGDTFQTTISAANHRAIITLVKTYGVDINKKNSQNKTPLECLLDKIVWNFSDVMALVSLGADPHTLNSLGEPLVHLLIGDPNDLQNLSGGKTKAIIDLVKKYGFDINKPNKQGKTPLQWLLEKKEWATKDAMTLVELGANPKTLDSNGQTLIHRLVTYHPDLKPHNIEAINELVSKYNFNINEPNAHGKTAFQSYLDKKFIEPETVIWFLKLGADPLTKTSQGESLIHKALPYDSYLLEHILRLYKQDVNSKSSQGKTPLESLLAGIFSMTRIESAKTLLQFKADPDSVNSSGDSLLHALASYGADHSQDIREVVEIYRANATLKNSHGVTPLQRGLFQLQAGYGHPNNVSALIDLTNEFAEHVGNTLKLGTNEAIHQLNRLMTNIHNIKKVNTDPLQVQIRGIAFQQLQLVIKDLGDDEKIEKLQWARKQPLFCMHRSDNFFASIGRTRTVTLIDNMIAELSVSQKSCAPN